MTPSLAPWLMLVVICGVCGCGRAADIELRDARVVRGEIVAGDRDSLYIRADSDDDRERPATSALDESIDRMKIVRISHPGDTSRWVGVGLLTAAAALAVAGAVVASNEDVDELVVTTYSAMFSGLLFTSGGIVLVTSLSRGATSRRAMETPRSAVLDASRVPN
jgi:predicted sugar kinase